MLHEFVIVNLWIYFTQDYHSKWVYLFYCSSRNEANCGEPFGIKWNVHFAHVKSNKFETKIELKRSFAQTDGYRTSDICFVVVVVFVQPVGACTFCRRSLSEWKLVELSAKIFSSNWKRYHCIQRNDMVVCLRAHQTEPIHRHIIVCAAAIHKHCIMWYANE